MAMGCSLTEAREASEREAELVYRAYRIRQKEQRRLVFTVVSQLLAPHVKKGSKGYSASDFLSAEDMSDWSETEGEIREALRHCDPRRWEIEEEIDKLGVQLDHARQGFNMNGPFELRAKYGKQMRELSRKIAELRESLVD